MKKNNSKKPNQSQEFATETDIQQVKGQNQQAELKKQLASGKYSRPSNGTK